LGVNGDIHFKEGRWILVETRFIADVMLGKLATWLRLLGCDVAYLPAISDEDLVEMASRSGRVILTRDLELIRRREARDNHFLVETDEACQFQREADHPGARFNHCHCQKVIKSISFSGVWKRNIRDLLHADG
jgi:uncharacterized protein with PIN domain